MYARLAGENERLRGSFLLATRIGFSVTFPLVLATMLFTEPMIRLALGAKWLAAAPVIKILAVSSLLRGLSGLGTWLFFAAGYPKYSFLVNALRLALLSVLVVPLALWFGLTGVALAVLTATACMFLVASALVTKKLGIDRFDYLKNLAPSLILSLALLGLPCLLTTSGTDLDLHSWAPFAALVMGGLAYTASLLYLERDMLCQVRRSFAAQS